MSGLAKESDPRLMIAIGCEKPWGDYFGVWILMLPNHPQFKAVREAVAPTLKQLRQRNSNWNPRNGDLERVVLELYAPLTDLLNAKNQQQKLKEYVGAALLDLKLSGAIDAITTIVAK